MDCSVNGVLLTLKKKIVALNTKIKKSKLEIEFIKKQIHDPERLKNHKIFLSGEWDTCGGNFYSRPSYEHTEDDFKQALRKIDEEVGNHENEIINVEGELKEITDLMKKMTITH